MIIDNHAHVIPDQAGPAGYASVETHARLLQALVPGLMGRMVSSHSDPKFIPEPGEDVDFRVGKYGRYHWRKHGEDCWMQRAPACMTDTEHSAEQMLAQMDSAGVDICVIQAGATYMELNYSREVLMRHCVENWPDRFIGTASIDYDLRKTDAELEGEIRKLTESVESWGLKALFDHVPRFQGVDDPRCDPLWAEVARLGVPAYWVTGLNSRREYFDQIAQLENMLRRHPGVTMVIPHVGFNLRHPNDPEWVDNPREFDTLLTLPNFLLEVGYVLAYENESIWGADSEYPYPRHREIIKYVYEKFGPEKMVWGSDMPFTQRTCTYQQCVNLIRHHCEFMTEEERALVLGGNLEKLYFG